MAKKFTYDEDVEEKPVDTVSTQKYNSISEVLIESLLPAQLQYVGKVSGRLYIWNKAGSRQMVAQEDAPELLSKRLKTDSCCNGTLRGNAVFQIVK